MRLFADTFYWIALTDSTDSAHDWAAQIKENLATTDEVLCELLNYFGKSTPFLRAKVVAIVEHTLRNPNIMVVAQNHDSFLDGLTLYRDRPDKGYSLVDCISMNTMRRLGLTCALTNDRHFEQEGFQALFRLH